MKNIAIAEGGEAKTASVHKLKTNLVEGGTVLWVPEDEVQLTTKNISENGTYNAADDGYYGYSSVTVSGVGKAEGKDADGNTVIAEVDPTTGELVVITLPSSIVVETLPTKLTYEDGEAINYAGMVVKAYKEDGEPWTDEDHPDGIIYRFELDAPTHAEGGSTIPTAVDPGGKNVPIHYTTPPSELVHSYESGGQPHKNHWYFTGGDYAVRPRNMAEYTWYVISRSDFEATYQLGIEGPSGNIDYYPVYNRSVLEGTLRDGRSFYSASTGMSGSFDGSPPVPLLPEGISVGDAANAIFLGTTSSDMEVVLNYARPGDGAVLSTSFEISVRPIGNTGGEDNEGGGTGTLPEPGDGGGEWQNEES